VDDGAMQRLPNNVLSDGKMSTFIFCLATCGIAIGPHAIGSYKYGSVSIKTNQLVFGFGNN
jgi:hypothetical protein